MKLTSSLEQCMNQTEKRIFLIKKFLNEQPQYHDIEIPQDSEEQKILLRSLMNIRPPHSIDHEFQSIQDEYLQTELAEKGIIELNSLIPVAEELYLWKGDITTLSVDAIVNAANSGMTGCYQPCHNCIDNCIHTYAGIQLRNECNRLMLIQGHEEATGQAKITKSYNLPCKYVIHTVGPIVVGILKEQHKEQLHSCYHSCLELAEEHGITSIAFCCISTGVYMFPNEDAAKIAIGTVREFKKSTGSRIKVIFNVFKEEDKRIYGELLYRSKG